MSKTVLSHLCKALVILFMAFSLLIAFLIMPKVANEFAIALPEAAAAKTPLLLVVQGLLLAFTFGLGIIFYLLVLFDKHEVYTKKFLSWLDALVVLCSAAMIVLALTYYYMTKLGGPGPSILLALFGTLFLVGVVDLVILLIKRIITESSQYKEQVDATV